MSFVVFKQLALGELKPTSLRLLMAERTMKKSVDILCDVLMKVETFIFPIDFVILDCKVEFKDPIILSSPFLAMH